MDFRATHRMMFTAMLASLVLIFGGYPLLGSSTAQTAENTGPGMAVDNSGPSAKVEDPAEVEDEDAADVDELEEEELMKLGLDMKAMDKDMAKLMGNEANLDRFFDPQVTKDLVDRDMLKKAMDMQKAMLDDFEKVNADGVKDDEEEDVELEDLDELELPDDLELGEAEELDDEKLLMIAMKMKVLEAEMEGFLESDGGTWEAFFRPRFNGFDRNFIDRDFLRRQLFFRNGLFDAFDRRVVALDPFDRPFFRERPFAFREDDDD
ncbi:MAG: hypothetical protein AB9873_04910 [Syntrophobacteraceae bacterium]